MHSMKSVMVLFVAPLLETHVFIAPCTISLWSYHREHTWTIAYYTGFLQLCKYKITKTSRQRICKASLKLPILYKCLT
jgi:hypothetical protein